MSYSRHKPLGIGKVIIKPEHRYGGYYGGIRCEDYLAKSFDKGLTWLVFNFRTGLVDAIYYAQPNVHGWSASEAHARSHLNRFSNVNPFELDNLP